MKKMVSIVLAIAITLSLVVSVFATDMGVNAAAESETEIRSLENRTSSGENDDVTEIEYKDSNIIGGSIYFNTEYREIVGCDDTVTEIVIPSEINGIEVEAIGYEAFKNKTALTKVVISESVTLIRNRAFSNSGITSICIPKSVTQVNADSFYNCKNLTEITVDSNNPSYKSIDGVLFDNIYLVCYPAGKTDKSYTVPADMSWSTVNVFDYNTFLESVTILEYTGSAAFGIACPSFSYCTNLKTVYLPLSLGGQVSSFAGCDSLTDIYYGGCEDRWDLFSNPSLSSDINIHCNDSDYLIDGVELEIGEAQSVVRFETIKDIGDYSAVVLKDGKMVGYSFYLSRVNNTYPAPKKFALYGNYSASCVVEVYSCQVFEGYNWSEHLGEDFDSSRFEDYLIGRASFAKEPEHTPGDLNGDGEIDITDSVLLLRYLVGINDGSVNEAAADYNGDVEVDTLDSVMLLRYLVGLN